MSDLPPWVADPALQPVWERLRARLERNGLEPRGYVVLRPVTRAERQALAALLGRPTVRDRQRVDLAELDARLHQRSGAGGLLEVVARVTGSPLVDRRAHRAERNAAREGPLALALELVRQPWSPDWVAGMRRTGVLTSRPEAEQVVRDAATVLAALPAPGEARHTLSRVELGARLLGDAHALDRDTLVHHVVLRGLAAAAGAPVPTSARDRESLWAGVGVSPDLVSRTCLVLGLRLEGDGPLAHRLAEAAGAGDPVHLSAWDLRRAEGVQPAVEAPVLVCENPRVLEAVAERRVEGWVVVCTAGEPNLVVDEVLGLLAEAGGDLRYHGDFDWPGLALAERAIRRHGVRPWLMEARDYEVGLAAGGPTLVGTPVEPSWDPELGAVMRRHGRAVHEEAVLTSVLDAIAPRNGS